MFRVLRAISRPNLCLYSSNVNGNEGTGLKPDVRTCYEGQRHYSKKYEICYQKAILLQHRYESRPLKRDERDIANDLFCQLGMGSANELNKEPFAFCETKLYPVPRRTSSDYSNYNYVKYYLDRNPEFKYKLRVSFICRILTTMLYKWYNKWIKYFDELAEYAYWSRVNRAESWESLRLQILTALRHHREDSRYMPPGISPALDKLCWHTAEKLQFNNAISNDTLSLAIYSYLIDYRPIEEHDKLTDDTKLHSDGATHSCISYILRGRLGGSKTSLEHFPKCVLAHYQTMQYLNNEGVLEVVNENEIKTRSCDLRGFTQLLLNFLVFHITEEHRNEVVAWLQETHIAFLNNNCSNYDQDDYTNFFSLGSLSKLPDMDLTFGYRITDAISDINQNFFEESPP